jgi:hypothetical protein
MPLMTRFNLSDWALRHRSLVVYLMLAFALAGALAYGKLGREEDPPFGGAIGHRKTGFLLEAPPGTTSGRCLARTAQATKATGKPGQRFRGERFRESGRRVSCRHGFTLGATARPARNYAAG